MKHTVRILLFAFCTLCSGEAGSLRKANTKFDYVTDLTSSTSSVTSSSSIGSIGSSSIGSIGSLDTSSSFGSSSFSSHGSSFGHNGLTQDICSKPGWISYCAEVHKSKSGAYVRTLQDFQRSHKGCRSSHSTHTHSSHTHSSHTHKKKKKGKGWLERAGDALEWYNKHSLLEEGSTTEASAKCWYTSDSKDLRTRASAGTWGTFTVHFVTPTSLIAQEYPVRGPWRINQANPTEKYREYSPTTGFTEPGKNYYKTFRFTGKYAQQEMELNGVGSTDSKQVKDCGRYYCMESGAPIHN